MNIVVNFCIFFSLIVFLFQKFLKPVLKENVLVLISRKKFLDKKFHDLVEENHILNFDYQDLDNLFLKKTIEERAMIQELKDKLIQEWVDYQFLCDEDFNKRKEYLQQSAYESLLNSIKDKIFYNVKKKINLEKFTLKMKEYCDKI